MSANDSKLAMRLGQPIDLDRQVLGTPPVILQVQPSGFVKADTPEQLRQFEADLRQFYGLNIDLSKGGVHCTETYESGCTGDMALM